MDSVVMFHLCLYHTVTPTPVPLREVFTVAAQPQTHTSIMNFDIICITTTSLINKRISQ